MLPALINELAELPEPFVLVLDDYHIVRDELVHDSLAYLLRHLPRTDARFTSQKGLARTFFVPADGTAEQNGDRLAAAIESLPKDNGAAALVLDPGYFDVGARTLELPSSTTVRGAARWKTMVRGTGTPFHVAAGSVGVRLEDLAVFSTGVAAFDVDGEATIDAVDMRTNNASSNVHTIDASNGSLRASDCTVAADARVAIPVFAKSLTLDGCKLTAKGTQLADGVVLLANGKGARSCDRSSRRRGSTSPAHLASRSDRARTPPSTTRWCATPAMARRCTPFEGTKLGSGFHCIGLYDHDNEPLACP